MFFFLFIFFLTASLSADEVSCNTNILENDEDFYRRLLSSANDSATIKEYVEKQGPCFKEGYNLIEARGVPILETFICPTRFTGAAAEYFFKDGDLCLRAARFFPSKNVFSVESHFDIKSVAEGWKFISGRNSILFFKKGYEFKEQQDVKGETLNILENDLFTNNLNRPVYPHFIFLEGKWQNVFPLRELFELNIKPDSNFEIKIITDSSLSYEKDKIVDTIGLKAELFQIETPAPSRYFISGSNISGVRIPKLKKFKKGKSFQGSYVINLTYREITPQPPKMFTEKNFQVAVSYSKNTMKIALTVFTKNLTVDEADKIIAIINQEVPPFHIIKKDVKETNSSKNDGESH